MILKHRWGRPTCNIIRLKSVLLIQDLIQQLHSRQQTNIFYCTMCLLNASASTWPSSGQSSTEDINNCGFCWRLAYVEPKIQLFEIRLLKVFKLWTNTEYFYINILHLMWISIFTTININMSASFFRIYPCFVSTFLFLSGSLSVCSYELVWYQHGRALILN
jgi:hypothetical protein